MMAKLWTFIKHNQFIIVFGGVAGFLILWGHGCEPKVASLTDYKQQVTRDELQFELDGLLAKAESRFAELDRQVAFKEAIFNHTILYATTGTIDPLGMITTIAALLGFGAVIDNRRKDSVIKTLKNSNAKNKTT